MADYASFRQRLDAVLRTLDVKQVQEFLIAENQWSEGTPADAEFAMWMMVGGSPTLGDLHERAREWLMTHGHEEDAKVFLTPDKKTSGKQGRGKPHTTTSKGERYGNKSSQPSKRKK